MVFIRMMAELTVLIILAGIPIYLFFTGELQRVSIITQTLLVVAGLVAAMIMPAYGFITYRVTIDDEGLRTIALFRKNFMSWQQITGLRLRAAFGWRRFVVLSEHEELSFPVWLNKVEELVEQIRERLPKGGRMIAVGGAKVYAQDAIGTAFTIFKLTAGIAFIFLFWMFFAYLQGHKASQIDALIILAACLVFTSAMLFRSYTILMMPRVVATDKDGVTLKSWFKSAQFSWDELKEIKTPLFFLPEGIVAKTSKSTFLIGNELDAFDELEDELRERTKAR